MEVEVTVKGIQFGQTLQNVVVRQVRRALDRFGDRVQHVDVRCTDLNGPRGGGDIRCRIVAHVHPIGQIVVQDTHDTAFQAIAGAAEKITRTTARRLGRLHERRLTTV